VKNLDAAVLQQPSAENTGGAGHRRRADLRAPGRLRTLGAGRRRHRRPAAPVFLNGCTYGAWGGSATFLRDCIGSGNDLKTSIEGAESNSTLVFRVNRDVVVLNDTASGAAWMATDNLQRVDNWQDIVPPEGDSSSRTRPPTTRSRPRCPSAPGEHAAGRARRRVRRAPGRTTMLPVLDNDTDADGDVLVASLAQEQPSIGEVQPINNGGALQIAVPEDATGSASFQYQADDGRGGKATATASVRCTTGA
jgi:hypothetical protein